STTGGTDIVDAGLAGKLGTVTAGGSASTGRSSSSASRDNAAIGQPLSTRLRTKASASASVSRKPTTLRLSMSHTSHHIASTNLLSAMRAVLGGTMAIDGSLYSQLDR